MTVSTLDNDKFFMCHVDEFKFLADMIEHVPLPLRMRYVFCCAPIPKKQPFVCTMFLKVPHTLCRRADYFFPEESNVYIEVTRVVGMCSLHGVSVETNQ